MFAHHDGSSLHVSTLTPALGEQVSVFVRTLGVQRVQLRTVVDGEPRFVAATVDRRTDDGVTWWRADLVARHQVTPYRFLLEGPNGPRWLTQLGLVSHDVPDATDFRLVTYAPPPDWRHHAVVYQIFPDRFARSAAADTRPLPDWAIRCDWDTPVIGRGPETPYQFYGGDLDGIIQRLDHLAELGINTVYLTPIFPARSNHRYDAAAFDRVDPLLGGDEALARLSEAVHARRWRLLGDVTTNHCGDAHPWFTTAMADVAAPEREMFYIDTDGDYESWWGVKSLPKFNWASSLLRRRFTDGPDSVLQRWLRAPYHLDGWRVDVANMTGRLASDDYARQVARWVRAAVNTARPDALLIAEHNHDATGDLDAGGWHGTMYYAGFLRPVWSWLRTDQLELPDFLGVPTPVPRHDGPTAVATMRQFAARMSWQTLTSCWTLLGSHDTPRVRTVVGDAARQEVAAGLLFTMPGTPMIFAGDELGLRGVNGEDSRTPMPWHRPEDWDRRTLADYQALIRLRQQQPALRHGGLRWLHVDSDVLVFAREAADGTALVLARRAAGDPVRLTAPGLAAASNVYGGAPDLAPDSDGAFTLPGDGPTFQVWHAPMG
jgi:alpha-glucosidase